MVGGEGLGQLEDAVGVVGELALVGEDDVVAVARGDRVRPRACEDEVVAVARGDDVVISRGGVEGGEGHRHPGQPLGPAVVAKDHVVPIAGGDRVLALAAEDDVPARARGDFVVRTLVGREGLRQLEDAVGVVGELALVGEDDVVAVARGDRVRPRACEDEVVAVARGDDVVISRGGVEGGEGHRHPGQPLGPAVVAKDHVVPVAGGDRVLALAAEDDVPTRARRDLVVRTDS